MDEWIYYRVIYEHAPRAPPAPAICLIPRLLRVRFLFVLSVIRFEDDKIVEIQHFDLDGEAEKLNAFLNRKWNCA